ncbi:usg protein [Prosthecomicrobium sp. N25]|uniref:usg protein n=1 Tax=Prosthecomicrobium sp. N25 TaxID=3129254 RepID=UPI0030784ABC
MPERRVDDAFRLQMEGYGLTTANILYRMPDHPAILQTYIWQDYDLAPKFPELERFLDFWNRELDGPIFKVEVAHQRLVRPGEWRAVSGLFKLH